MTPLLFKAFPLAFLFFFVGDSSPAPGPGDLVNFISSAGTIGLLSFFSIGFFREWWVPGSVYRRAVTESQEREVRCQSRIDKYEEIAMANLTVAERASTVSELAVQVGTALKGQQHRR